MSSAEHLRLCLRLARPCLRARLCLCLRVCVCVCVCICDCDCDCVCVFVAVSDLRSMQLSVELNLKGVSLVLLAVFQLDEHGLV